MFGLDNRIGKTVGGCYNDIQQYIKKGTGGHYEDKEEQRRFMQIHSGVAGDSSYDMRFSGVYGG